MPDTVAGNKPIPPLEPLDDEEEQDEPGPPAPVLYADTGGYLTGASRSLLDILASIDRERFPPLVVLLQQGEVTARLAEQGVTPLALGPTVDTFMASATGRTLRDWLRRQWLRLKLNWRLVALVRQHRVRVVHANDRVMQFFTLLVRLCTDACVIWHLRGPVTEERRGWLYIWLAGWVPHEIIANSLTNRAALGERSRAIRRTTVIHSGIDLDRFAGGERETLRRAWGCDDGDIVVLHVARLCPAKGQHLLLEAAARILAAVPEVRLVFVGSERPPAPSSPYARRLRQRAQDLGVAQRVVWAGWLEDTVDAYAACDIYVNSAAQVESFGRCLTEAMGARRPVVAFDEGGPAEIVKDGESGLLVLPGNAGGLAAAVVKLAQNRAQRHAFGVAGRARARFLFDRGDMGPACMRVYQNLLTPPA